MLTKATARMTPIEFAMWIGSAEKGERITYAVSDVGFSIADEQLRLAAWRAAVDGMVWLFQRAAEPPSPRRRAFEYIAVRGYVPRSARPSRHAVV